MPRKKEETYLHLDYSFLWCKFLKKIHGGKIKLGEKPISKSS